MSSEYELVDGRWYVGGKKSGIRIGAWFAHRPVVMVGILGFVCGAAAYAIFRFI